MADMRNYVNKGGRYGFSLVNGVELEAVVTDHVYGSSSSGLPVRVDDRDGITWINPDHICYMWTIDESAAEKKPIIYDM